MRKNRNTFLYVGLFILVLNAVAHGVILDISATIKEHTLPNNQMDMAIASGPNITDQTMAIQAINAAVVVDKGFTVQFPVHIILDVEDGVVNRFYMETLEPRRDYRTLPTADGPSTSLVSIKHVKANTQEYLYVSFPGFANGPIEMVYENADSTNLAFPSPMNVFFTHNTVTQKYLSMKMDPDRILKDMGDSVLVKHGSNPEETVFVDKQNRWWETEMEHVEVNPLYKIPSTIHVFPYNQFEREFKIESISIFKGDEGILDIPTDSALPHFDAKTNELLK